MEIKTLKFELETQGNSDIIDITKRIQEVITSSGLIEGNVLIFAPGSTSGITTIEYEPGLLKDYPQFFEKLIPSNKNYHHDNTWGDGNGYAHIRSALQGNSFSAPFANSNLLLGTWQQIVFIDFDNRARKRTIIVQIIGKR